MFDEMVNETILNTDHRDNLLSMPHPYDYSATYQRVTNTVTETTLYTKTIAAGDLGTNGFAELVLCGYISHTTADSLYFRIKLGGTTILASSDPTPMANVNVSVPWELRVQVANLGSTSSQYVWATYNVWNPSVASGGVGYGNFTHSTTSPLGGIMANTASVVTSSAVALAVTVQWSVAAAGNIIDRYFARMLLGKN